MTDTASRIKTSKPSDVAKKLVCESAIRTELESDNQDLRATMRCSMQGLD